MSENAANWKKWLLVITMVIAAAALLFGPAKTFYHRHKENRSLTLAKSFFDKGDYANAALSARQALLLNPTNAAAGRLMADLADLSQSPAALDWRRQLAEAAPTAENKLKLAETGLRYQSRPFPLTAQILQELAATAAILLAVEMLLLALWRSWRSATSTRRKNNWPPPSRLIRPTGFIS